MHAHEVRLLPPNQLQADEQGRRSVPERLHHAAAKPARTPRQGSSPRHQSPRAKLADTVAAERLAMRALAYGAAVARAALPLQRLSWEEAENLVEYHQQIREAQTAVPRRTRCN
jgi:hypothetical protein